MNSYHENLMNRLSLQQNKMNASSKTELGNCL